ncbi:MAG: FecR domain-containing protein [Crocinitomicaceae bacterium]|nr:FecR domain-containing protein [Crocinitomicaceae bacterium]
MKEEGHIDDELLGRWLSGEMTPEELASFESSDSFETYRHIAEFSSKLSTPSFDDQALFDKIQVNKRRAQAPVVKMRNYRWVGIAATFIVLIGIGSLFFVDWGIPAQDAVLRVSTDAETKEIVLPSKSKVNLNVASTIEYDRSTNWEDERVVELKGEAYFDVTKGRPFSVKTSSGTISVLGTEFNIRERNGTMEISCYEGKVKVTDTKSQSVILTVGESAKIVNGKLVTSWTPELEDEPTWFTGESSFYEASLENVFIELENQYGIDVQRNQDYSNRLYSGAFVHENLEDASKMVFLPMQISYEIIGDSLIVIK